LDLEKGAAQLGLTLSAKQFANLRQYMVLLKKWNKAYNLTAVEDEKAMVKRHILDSLALHPFLDCDLLIDVGTGAGLPGIPLAIANPDKQVVLIDSNGKKTRFLFQVKLNLNLSNVSIENCRAEHYQSTGQVAIVMSRAFASLGDMVSMTRHLPGEGGKWFAMKGQYPDQEIAALASLPDRVDLLRCEPLQVPGEKGERHLLILAPESSTI